MRDRLITLAKIVVSLGLIAYVISSVDLAKVGQQLASANVGFLLLAFVVYLTAMTVNAVKWRILLGAQRVNIPFTALLQFQFIGFFFNNFLPATVGGDVMRGYGLARYTDRTADAAVSVVVDRIIGLTAYMVTAAVAAIVAVSVTGHGELQGIEWVAIVAMLGLALILGALFSRRLRALVGRLFSWRWLTPLAPVWNGVSSAFDCYRFRYGALVMAFGVAFLGILCTTLANWFLSLSMGGAMSLPLILLFNPLIALALIVPISIGGLGASQTLYLKLFSGLGGVPEGHAVAVSVLLQVIAILASLPGGVLWLRIRRAGQQRGPGARMPGSRGAAEVEG